MITTFAYTLIFGKPIIMYFGILTYVLLFLTISIAVLNVHFGVRIIPFKWHPRLGFTTATVATLHAIMGIALYFNF